jgi:hypothetical protein
MSEPNIEARLKTQQENLLALETIVAYVFSELAKQDPKLEAAIKTGFDRAALSAEVLAMDKGGSARGKVALNILEMIKGFRKVIFGGSPQGGKL